MKKFIALTIALSIFGAVLIVPMSEASREAYHSYISQKIKESGRYRHYAFNNGRASRLIFPRENKIRRNVALVLRKNYLIPRFGKRNLYSHKTSNRNLPLRTFTNRVFGVSINSQKPHRIVISATKEINDNPMELKNYNNEIISLGIPAKFEVSEENNVIKFNKPFSSIKFSAKKMNTKCQNSPFVVCARSNSHAIDQKNDIYRSSKTVQQYQKTDVVLGQVGLDSEKFVEGFIGTKRGKNFFVARFFVAGENGDVFEIEATSNLQDIDEAIILAKKVFETFRAKY